ncbi:MAG: tetratricopeptide repeat protein [Minwuia sp.]|nr:tetratricopeptide repeat protein [Minwuia sp.]
MRQLHESVAAALLFAGVTLCVAPAHAAFLEGVAAYSRGDFAAAADIWREDAASGDAAAQRNLGLLYLNGQGVPKNEAAAAEWFRRSSDQGFPRASANLGELYLRGVGVPRDPERAVSYFQRAAEAGLPEAQHNFAILIEAGYGVKKDPELARRWFQRAAAGGHAPARERLRQLAPGQVASEDADDAVSDLAEDGALSATDEARKVPRVGDGGLIDSLNAILSPSG